MRIMNICAALSGAAALIMLAVTHHMRGDADYAFVLMAAVAQLGAAAAGLAIANRTGLVNAVAGALMLGGADLFAAEICLSTFNDSHPFHMLAPIGGAAMILGWIVLAFARPGA
jgi:uncharacterized membrane protein YgdD (TMEM256/DUF423 family)